MSLADWILKLFRPVRQMSPLWPLARRYAWSIPTVAGLGFLASLLEGLGISLLVPLLGTLLQSGAVDLPGPLAVLGAFARRFEPDTRLVVVGGAILGFVAMKGVVQAANASLIAWVDGKVGHHIRCGIAERLLDVGYPFFLREDNPRLLNILSAESWRASEAIRIGFSIVASSAAVTVFLLLLLILDWKLTIAVAAGAALIRLLHGLFMRSAEKSSYAVASTNARLGELMLRIVQDMRLIRVFGQQAAEADAFQRQSHEVFRAMLRAPLIGALGGGFVEVANAALFVAILIGAYFAGSPLPALAAFLVLLYRMQPFLRELGVARLGVAATKGSVDEVEWLLDPEGKPRPPSGVLRAPSLDDAIVFEDVSFAYGEDVRDAPVLHHASFAIKKGRTTALIGRSGSGKSTVINLICRLLEPTGGRITVDGTPLAQIDPAAWRARIGFAGQDVDFLEGTIADNIRYGARGASLEEVAAAARLAQIDEFIDSLPEGYATRVGPNGMALSGGQRQRMALARAFVRKPDLLILDEATNAVDALSEAAILDLVSRCEWRPTTLVVSHRQSTLASCEEGIVLEGGRVVETGPLKSLKGYRGMSAAAAKALEE